MKLTRSELDELMARHGLAPLIPGGTDASEAARGGILATVDIAPGEVALMRVGIEGVTATGRCPLDFVHASGIVEEFREGRLLPHDTSFQHMFAHLLMKLSELYVASGANMLSISELHLHPASYHIEDLAIDGAGPRRLARRLEPDSHDRRAVFSHRHGDSVKFPK